MSMRRIIVNGGSRGIGAAVVRRFCKNGDKVVFIYKSADAAAEKLCAECGAVSVKADMSNASSVSDAVNRAIELLGGVDVLVNSTGIAQIKLFTELTDVEWNGMISTNLSSSFYACRAAARAMIAEHSGRIVNIGSMWGRAGASCEVHYSASKAGLRGLTVSLAKELGPSGITVNCVEPGVIDTEMNSKLDEETRAALIESTPLCRIGSAEDVAETVFFLASDGASFITGQCIGVDGGFTI